MSKGIKKVKKVNIKYIFFMICLYVLIFQNLLQVYIPFFQYFDEFLAVLSIPVFFTILIKKKGDINIQKNNIYLLGLYFILISVGFISFFKYRYQPFFVSMLDLLLVSKFFLVYFLSEMILDKELIDDNRIILSKHFKIIITSFFSLTILNYIFKIWPQQSIRFGIMSNQLFYTHPTSLAAICVFLLASLILTTDIKSCKKYIAMILFVLLSTLRFKAIGAALIILFVIIYINKTNKKISIFKLGLVAILAIILAWGQISYYYINIDGSARKVLNETSVKIAKDYFPIGTGFATFGSHFSSVYYSPIYYKYGISNVWGLVKGESFFLTDTFWPMIIGQFGVIGVITYILMIIIILKKIQDCYSDKRKQLYIAKIICFAYLIISSTSEAAFVHPIAIPLALILGIKKESNI